ncbi:thiamine-phosphate kinase [soil metagenome]
MVGEFDLIDEIRTRAAGAGVLRSPRLALPSGDDCAVTVPGGATATSTDAIVDGVHFRLDWTTPEQVGGKAVAVALSDLAAMGAQAGEIYVQLGLPAEMDDADVLTLADGAIAASAEAGAAIAGGDIVASPVLFVAVTVVGHAARPESFVTRGGAEPGDLVVLSGELGGAAAGLRLFESPELGTSLNEVVADALRGRQVSPRPRLELGAILAAAGAGAMIDVSDGLAGDACHLADASGVVLEIDLGRVPVQAGVAEVAAAIAIETAELLLGGEDYELLATISSEMEADAIAAAAAADATLTVIGRVSAGAGIKLLGARPLRGGRGFRHRR